MISLNMYSLFKSVLMIINLSFQRDLDVLKIDVEGHEWSVIEYLLTSPILPRIKQFALEYHLFPDWPPKSQYPRCLSTYKNLSDKGFRKFFTGLHPLQHTPESFNIQADVGYVNTRYKPTIRRLQWIHYNTLFIIPDLPVWRWSLVIIYTMFGINKPMLLLFPFDSLGSSFHVCFPGYFVCLILVLSAFKFYIQYFNVMSF